MPKVVPEIAPKIAPKATPATGGLSGTALAQAIDAALPQTQCQRCGYPDCSAYAQAIAHDGAPINQCQPGGEQGIQRLAAISARPALPLNPDFGFEAERSTVYIDEEWCIGCTLCLHACPVDAIIGANKTMHTVAEALCTGCELCIPVCPVDCIEIEIATPNRTGWAAWSPALAEQAKARYAAKKNRLETLRQHEESRLAALSPP